MRIWDLDPSCLCREHLLAEHRELHAIWSILVNKKKGYSRHPETLRWKGKLKALFLRHEKLVSEMRKRGYKHYTSLDENKATGIDKQDVFLNTIEEQKEILKRKGCNCLKKTI
jgi:hypothetical protein